MRMMLWVMVAIALALPTSAQEAGVLGLFPAELAGATRRAPARAFDAKTVYDYMDGGADAYLRYDFRQLYQADYTLGEQTVTVELYDMGSGPEAFGKFTTDQDGKPVEAGQGARLQVQMLRAWTDRFFLKVAAEQETPEFREFAVALARHFAKALGTRGARPELLAFLPEKTLQPKGVRYFHAWEDMNNAYYVSTQNVLAMAKGRTEAAFAEAKVLGQPLKVVVIRYQDPKDRTQAIGAFTKVIFSKKAVRSKDGTWTEAMGKLDFTGMRPFTAPKGAPMLALCFEAKTPGKAVLALNAIAASGKQ